MKIDITKIPPEGVILTENFSPQALDLETDLIKFRGSIRVEADISRITNAVSVNLSLSALMHANCGRCLDDFEIDLKKEVQLNYPVNPLEAVLDLDPEIREEIILDYPIKPLCKADCKGLCPRCGENLNEGGCSCGST